MRLADVVLRRGHLSDEALVEVWTSGVHPAHLDRCQECTDRAIDMSRWLEDVKAVGQAEADLVFSDDRLTAQRGSIMETLAALDRPSKVLSFPAASANQRDAVAKPRVASSWVAVAAAAAGLMIGVVTVELSHLLPTRTAQPPAIATASPASAPTTSDEDGRVLDGIYDRPSLDALGALEEMTPRVADLVLVSNR